VGVHDLHHDGKLYNSRKGFAKNAVRINKYLRDWDAAGFRSGFMLNNLDWLHDLDIAYDASTFDTDPFEPQPEGRDTIFPFWVPRSSSLSGGAEGRGELAFPSDLRSRTADVGPLTSGSDRGGYVELPSTLAQDSTLFLVLGETTPNIWYQKARWVAKNGGVAMIGVHPDYIAFGKSPVRPGTYPEKVYKDFLLWLRQEYSGAYWNATPRELAHYFLQSMQEKRRHSLTRLVLLTSVTGALGNK
jgi:hypothetical protein